MPISISTQKGGVGKTTTAITLSSILAKRGFTVLLIDIDPQANSSKIVLGKEAHASLDPERTLFSTLTEKKSIPFYSTDLHPKLFLAPAHIKMSKADLMLANEMGRETRLKKQLAVIQEQFDFIIIDCPPAISFLTINAFVASERVIIPVGDGVSEVDALTEIVKTLKEVQEEFNPGLDVLGILYTMADQRTRLHAEILAQLKASEYGPYLFQTIIPRGVKVGEAHANRSDIDTYDPKSFPALAYNKLVDEVLERINHVQRQ